MPPWICETCGNLDYQEAAPPDVCAICADDRQWVPAGGQRWTTLAELVAAGCRSDIREVEPGLTGIGATRQVGIGQRGLFLTTEHGNVLWDPSGFVDDDALRAVREAGGLHAVSASHPHFYGAIVEWARAFDAEILLPEADISWLARPSAVEPLVRTWEGTRAVFPGVTLVQCGGHFPGSSVLHWAEGADGAGVILSGDTINVSPGEDRVAFLYSAPNRLPLPEQGVHGVIDAVRPYPFDRIYAHWWEPAIRHSAQEVLKNSTDHYLQILRGQKPEWINPSGRS
ncbi:MBL fold metallo-hydrolase [Streptomyces sp. NPDC001985]|uniref:MBL fold metallo-hydrolase n=1 Tax=Streptomyces sp. NPDC001985 TaxID=3154406 RepID=UPI00332AB242